MQAIRRARMPLLGKILLLALAYLVAGRLALLLAIPPGFVSAMFPPVGIALAAVLIWGYPLLIGVLLGSTLLNLSIGGPLSLPALLVAGGIALGTSLQCALACWLIRRVVGFPNPLIDERSIFLLLLIGGPLPCMVGASGGVASLYANQIISAAQVAGSWLTWWAGDSIGVLIATPLMFILFAQPRPLWRSRINSVGLPLLIGSAIMLLVFIRASAGEEEALRIRFHQQAKLMSTALKARFELYSYSVQSIERLFAASHRVDRPEFAAFVANLPSLYPGVRALGWNQLVSQAQRASYEAAMLEQGYAGFHIRQRNASGNLITAGVRDLYTPVTYIEPLANNSHALGYDLASEPSRHAAMQRARDTGEVTMTAPVSLVQDPQQEPSVLLFYPVYQGPRPTGLTERRQQLQGYATAVVRISELINAAVSDYPGADFQLRLADITDASPAIIYATMTENLPAYARPLVWQETWPVAGRSLQLSIAPSNGFLQRNQSRQSWAQLVGGLLLCSLLGGFLLSMSGRAEQVRRLVKQRTLELSAILENAAEAILIFDQQGHIERCNPAASQLFGYDAARLLTQPLDMLLPTLHGQLEASLPDSLGNDIEVPGQHADGQQLQLEISLSRFALPGRQRYICLLRDIAPRKQVEQLKNEFISTVSHELRTPLTSIKGSLGLLSAGVFGQLPAPAQELVDIAQSNSERLVSLVNDLLDIEKLECGQLSIQLTDTDLRPLLQQALELNQGYAESFKVQLRLDDSALPEQLMVAVDSLRLQQVLSNLISNAVKFSNPGGRVEISARPRDGHVEVAVRDYGVGIAEEFRPRIFQKFAQVDGSDTRRHGGTGLGLSICKTLMARMHGQIGFHSVPGEGRTFYFSLPVV